MAQDVIAEQRRLDALFSRTGLQGDAYAFLRRTDPGSDLTYAPRRGFHYATSTSATMSGAGYLASDAMGVDGSSLRPGEVLLPGQRIQSPNRQFRLEFQKDGNLVLYNPQNAPLWTSNTQRRGAKAMMQTDGNFVIYDRTNRPSFATNTAGRPGAYLAIQNDANLVVYLGKSPIWDAGTWGGVRAGTHDSKSFFQKVGGAVTSVGEGAFNVGKGIVNAGIDVTKATANLAIAPAKLAQNIAQGKNVFGSLKDSYKDAIANARTVAPYAQAVLSVVPGVGQGVSGAIGAGLALAQGQPITQALVAGVRSMVPGGPLAQAAFDTAYGIAQGKSVTDAALQAARSQIPPGPGQAAFDVGLALAHGKNIQDVAKEQGMALISNVVQNQLSPIANRALSSTGPVVGKVVSAAVSVIPPNVKQAAQALLNNPGLRSLPVSEVARRLGLPERDVQQGLASVVQAAERTGQGQIVRALGPAQDIARRVGNATFDQALSRFGSRMAPIALGPNRGAPRVTLPRFPKLMPGAMGLQEAGAFATIKLGSTGPDVAAWQKVLGVAADGKFGPQTDAATRSWQRAHGLTPDGVVGPKTWAAVSTAPGAPPPPPTLGTVSLPTTVITATPPPPLTPAQTAAAQSMPTLRLGSSGASVATWQGILRRDSGISGFTGALDGKFGPATDAATRAWQRSSGLAADGVVGPNTWKKGIGSLTTPPLPAEKAPGIPLPTPAPPGLPPGLPPVPTVPASAPPPIITLPPMLPPSGPPPELPPVMPPIVTRPPAGPPPTPTSTGKPAGNGAALAAGAVLLTKLAGLW
jgi:peptidoglycan hydrolase-like protein with peptidoglycan-binding domain